MAIILVLTGVFVGLALSGTLNVSTSLASIIAIWFIYFMACVAYPKPKKKDIYDCPPPKIIYRK